MTPRPSASIILLRSVAEGLEVLMARRNEAARFMPGVWVFPGGAVDPEDGDPASGDATYRICARRELAEEAGITLPDRSELVLFARWITPEFLPIRFDARFYLAQAPAEANPRADGGETIEVRWMAPDAVLRAKRQGEMEIAFPTMHQLTELSRFQQLETLLADYRDRPPAAILPVPVPSESGMRLSLPGDADYPA